jgi:hypothetical protein
LNFLPITITLLYKNFIRIIYWREIIIISDCNCQKCYAAHYPCNDVTCDYCDSVRNLIRDGHVKGIIDGGIIDYATYNAVGMRGTYNLSTCTCISDNYSISDMLYRPCVVCNILIDGLTSDNFEETCSQALSWKQIEYITELIVKDESED